MNVIEFAAEAPRTFTLFMAGCGEQNSLLGHLLFTECRYLQIFIKYSTLSGFSCDICKVYAYGLDCCSEYDTAFYFIFNHFVKHVEEYTSSDYILFKRLFNGCSIMNPYVDYGLIKTIDFLESFGIHSNDAFDCLKLQHKTLQCSICEKHYTGPTTEDLIFAHTMECLREKCRLLKKQFCIGHTVQEK